ncbi:DUF4142 domain-containing protein [Nibribacter ruber]|uniref:DUF4142 domain-containing protein n=1 Tax=Nibribacter ruber TaxID=2698458 RepID=A0A6P1P223_9BACT|nr:DUF4142 domain-containing protein [Nibribacter ruber]QHL88447.1 DUF4142 domain-containing protein [Nibribacter ruber]
MRNLKHIWMGALAAGALAGCSRIDASTANTVPTTDGYTNNVMSTNDAAGVTKESGSAGYMTTTTTGVPPATMQYDNRPLTEERFLTEAASSSLLEVALGRLAVQKAMDPEVKQFGQTMIDYHAKARQDLKTVADGMNLDLPVTMIPRHQKLLGKLQDESGASFDRKYMDAMEEAHKEDLAKFEMVSNSAASTSVRAFAIRTLPILRVHTHRADQLEDKVERAGN